MDEPLIPWARVAAFIRQHTHDVRNGLNCLDLEAALLHELVPEGEAGEGVARMRKQLRTLAQQLRLLSALFQEPQPIAAPVPAKVLLSIWREKHAALPEAIEVHWVDELSLAEVSVDVEMMASVFHELLLNAANFRQDGPATVTAREEPRSVIFELREPKTEALETAAWGEPFVSALRGSYGLGLWTVRRLIAANHGTFTQRYLPGDKVLLTQITLPRSDV